MEPPTTGTENKEYVRRLLKRRQPEFSAALELALVLAELELTSRRSTETESPGSRDSVSPAERQDALTVYWS